MGWGGIFLPSFFFGGGNGEGVGREALPNWPLSPPCFCIKIYLMKRLSQ